jgi:hypothetical protein
MSMSRILVAVALGIVAAGAGLVVGADEPAPKPADPGTLIVVDGGGKEQKIKAYRILTGTRHLGWLATEKPAEAPKEEKKREEKEEPDRKDRFDKPAAPSAQGPEALVLREGKKINFLAGVLTLIPLERVRTIEFDNKEETMTVRAATGARPEEDVVLTGTTAYKGINKLTLEADIDKGDAGIASLTLQGGVPRGIRGVRFPPPKVQATPAGRPAVVQTADKDIKETHKVTDLQPLYRLAGGQERLIPTLMFKKTLKLDVKTLEKITAGSADSDDNVWQVKQKDGEESTLTLLETLPVDGKPATLLGLVGRAPVGYKLFPLRRIVEIQFDAAEPPKEKEKEKEKD